MITGSLLVASLGDGEKGPTLILWQLLAGMLFFSGLLLDLVGHLPSGLLPDLVVPPPIGAFGLVTFFPVSLL